jgi:hypothetical protein
MYLRVELYSNAKDHDTLFSVMQYSDKHVYSFSNIHWYRSKTDLILCQIMKEHFKQPSLYNTL